MANRGERAVLDAEGHAVISPIENASALAALKPEEWNEYHLVCAGPRIALKVNGELVAEVVDDDVAQQDLQGILGLLFPAGTTGVVQFKDIRLKILKPAGPQHVRLTNVPLEAAPAGK